MRQFVRTEWFLAVAVGTGIVFQAFEEQLFEHLQSPPWLAAIFAWLFIAVLGSALGVVRHAEQIAERLGEPYGTLVLTLSITSIEVMSISAVMLHGGSNPTLVRDTLFAVVMIVLGGMVGLSLLFGALRHREQYHNLQGANAYLGVIIPLAVLTLVLPNFVHGGPDSHLALSRQIGLAVMASALYVTFLVLQTGRHRGYFIVAEDNEIRGHTPKAPIPAGRHALLLLAYMVPVVFLVHHLARPIDYVTETLGAPSALGGIVMAVLVATPEAIGAVRAAREDHLQRAVNISLGSVLSTIGLTVPAMLVVTRLAGHQLVLGLDNTNLVLLVLTLAVSMITFASGRTHLLQGAVHVVLFATYVLLLVQG